MTLYVTAERAEKLFVGGKFIKPQEFSLAKEKAATTAIPIPEAIVELGYLSDVQVGRLLAEEEDLLFVDLSKEQIESGVLATLPERVAVGQVSVVYKRTDKGIWMASANPDNYEFFKLVEKKFHLPVSVAYATPLGVKEALKGYQKDLILQMKNLLKQMEKTQHDEDIVQLVHIILASAYEGRASDVHIEPEEEEVVVRYRVDGSMHEIVRYPAAIHEKVVFRIKILARLRTDEHAQAQDGRFDIKLSAQPLNLRVSIIPITHGENVVLRLLSERFQRLRLEDLGLQSDDLDKIKRAAEMPHGMIIAAGPTGSGKTTTLYAIIHILNQPDINLMTIEDPVEYNIKGIRQIQVNPRTNLTFEAGLKSVVRQDPDVIMVGEIRDPETADIAVNAALTGHLLLSTLHANDAATTFPRLFEMSVEPFLIASSVNVVLAQRLVRKVCSNCVESYFLDEDEGKAIEHDKDLLQTVLRVGGEKTLKKLRFYRGKGCNVCHHIGYTGRIGIFEILEVTEELRPMIVNKASSDEIRNAAIKLGMRTMLEDGVVKVFQGQTTIAEIIRATKS